MWVEGGNIQWPGAVAGFSTKSALRDVCIYGCGQRSGGTETVRVGERGNMKRLVLVLAVLASVAIAGCASDKSESSSSEPKEERVATQVAESTPQACLDALDDAEEAFGLAAEGFSLAANVSEMIGPAAQAGFDQDAATIRDLTDQLHTNNAELDAVTSDLVGVRSSYQANAAECRSK